MRDTVVWEYFDEEANVLIHAEVRAGEEVWVEPGHEGQIRYARRTDPDGSRHLFDVVAPHAEVIEKNREQGKWTTRSGVVIPVEEMEPRHAAAIIRYLARHDIEPERVPLYERIAERAATL